MTPDTPPAEAAASGKKFRPCPSILTNMAFWQSRLWMRHAHSIYDLQPGHEPEPLSPLMEAIRLFRRRKRYEVVVTMGARTSLYYGLLCAAAGVDARQVMCEVFLDPERGGWRYRFKTALYRLVARRSLGILTNSSSGALPSLPASRSGARFPAMSTLICFAAAAWWPCPCSRWSVPRVRWWYWRPWPWPSRWWPPGLQEPSIWWWMAGPVSWCLREMRPLWPLP